ncbi:protein of unknown function [Cupriavidus taiwanensis]|nr:protein of unknown function [Cupriavidus taiwanensis]
MARHLRAQGHTAGRRRTPDQGIAEGAEGSGRDQKTGRTWCGNRSGRQADAGRVADAAEGGKRQVAATVEVDEGRSRLSQRTLSPQYVRIFTSSGRTFQVRPSRLTGAHAHRFCLRPTPRRGSIPPI